MCRDTPPQEDTSVSGLPHRHLISGYEQDTMCTMCGDSLVASSPNASFFVRIAKRASHTAAATPNDAYLAPKSTLGLFNANTVKKGNVPPTFNRNVPPLLLTARNVPPIFKRNVLSLLPMQQRRKQPAKKRPTLILG